MRGRRRGAFGLLKTPQRSLLLINVKLRMCDHCHTGTKAVSEGGEAPDRGSGRECACAGCTTLSTAAVPAATVSDESLEKESQLIASHVLE